jgi:hypothetical protein
MPSTIICVEIHLDRGPNLPVFRNATILRTLNKLATGEIASAAAVVSLEIRS